MIGLDRLAELAGTAPAAPAVSDERTVLSWAGLRDRVAALRAWLTARLDDGATNQAVVVAPNTADVVIVAAALGALGVPWVGIDPARDDDTVRSQVRAVAPTLLVVDRRLRAGRVAAQAAQRGALLLDLAPVHAGGEQTHAWAAALAGTCAERAWRRPPYRALGFTSGSTGVPKLFVRSSKSEDQRQAYLRRCGIGPASRFLITSPLSHASGHVWAAAALALGAQVVLGAGTPDELVGLVAERRIDAGFFVPPALEAFVAAACARPAADLSSLRLVLTGGRHLSPRALRQAAGRLGHVVHLYYATTETGINTMAPPDELRREPQSAGFPMPGVALRIVEPGTLRDLPPGELGLIAVASPVNMDGYVHGGQPALERDGRRWIVTSDFGRLGGRGELRIASRSDALPGDGSLDVVALEGELKELPGVEDVCVVRRPGSAGVEVVAALVAAVPDAPSTVAAHLERALAAATPVVIPVPAIPYNTAGKVDLRRLHPLLG